MEAIKIYIENVFKAFGDNERVTALKRDMLAGMEEKYNALKAEGKSENEAVGSVIADFGSIDEIVAELGTPPIISELRPAVSKGAYEEDDEGIPVSREDALRLTAAFKKASKWLGIGVWLILTGVSTMMMIVNSGFNTQNIIGETATRFTNTITNPGSASLAEAVALFALFLFIIPAVILFIINGMSLNRYYEKYGNKALFLDSSTRTELEQMRERFMPKFTAVIAAGVAIVLLAVGGFLLFANLGLETFAVSALIFTIGFAAFLFIVAGMEYHAYDYVLGRGDYGYITKKQSQDSERIIGTVAAVFWPLITAVYLLWSFVGDSWSISWLIWPISGILFGAFAGGISVWTEGKK
ncbi:MAG: permease prefix domain 1-containing protein [Oscillospiraceae bacterium]|nr:permease prefix domain 1-containing protein [Oscillospiraceae bacterium]